MMTLDLGLLDNSYANAIGTTLKQPLYGLVSTTAIALSKKSESALFRIAKIVALFAAIILLIAPAALFWLLGESISYFSKTKIDASKLNLKPTPIKLPEVVDGEVPDFSILAAEYCKLNIPETAAPGTTSKAASLARLCNSISQRSDFIYQDNDILRSIFFDQMSLFLTAIIKKMNSGGLSDDQKRALLIELAEASTRCFPTWIEVASRLYDEVYGTTRTVNDKILQFVQDYKENIILSFCQQEFRAF